MKELGSYQRRGFLKDHPPVLASVLIGSTGSEAALPAGTVLGITDGKHSIYAAGQTASCVLAEDTVIPAAGDRWAMAYVHAAMTMPELIWDEGVSAKDQKTALEQLRSVGIYTSVA